MKNRGKWGLLLLLLLLCGCADRSAAPAETAPRQTAPVETAAPVTAPAETTAAATVPAETLPPVPEAQASGTAREENDRARIDYSNAGDGYVMAQFTGETETRLKALVKGPTVTYKYDLPQDGWSVFPLSDGDGSYQVGIYENISGTRYALVLAASFDVALTDEFAPFLRPNQYVNYSADSPALALAAELTQDQEATLDKVAAVYDYVTGTLTYDEEKARTVQKGYLPDIDRVLEEQKGICFDYASLMTAMLRSQGIPCKLVVGYAGEVYHAWISVWTQEEGWLDGVLFFDGHNWHRMDPTFASSSGEDPKVMDFIKNGNYQQKYLY